MKLQVIGDYLFEFFVVSILLIASFILVIPFVPMIVGVAGYFEKNIDSRRFKDIFTTIKKNLKIIVLYTIFQITILVVSALNIFYFNTHLENMNAVILILSYVSLFIGLFYLVTAPIIIVHMNVTFRQLLFNSLMLLFGNIKNTSLTLLLIILIVLLVLYFPYVVFALFYLVALLSQKWMRQNFFRLKARVLGISFEELMKQGTEDEFLKEFNEQ